MRAESSFNQMYLNKLSRSSCREFTAAASAGSSFWVWGGGGEGGCKGQKVGTILNPFLLPAPEAALSALQRSQKEQRPHSGWHALTGKCQLLQRPGPKLGPEPNQLSPSCSGTMLLSPGSPCPDHVALGCCRPLRPPFHSSNPRPPHWDQRPQSVTGDVCL